MRPHPVPAPISATSTIGAFLAIATAAITVGALGGEILALRSLSAGALSAPAAPAAPASAPTAEDFLGRWNILIDDTGDTFRSAGLAVERAGEKLGGGLVWKWGSFEPIRDLAVADGVLSFVRGDERYEARLDGAGIVGTATMGDGKSMGFRGKRAIEMCDAAGTWKVWGAEDPERRETTVRFEGRDGKIAGSAEDPDGHDWRLRDLALAGYVLGGKAVRDLPEGGELSGDIRLEVRGDRLVGDVTMVFPGETEKRKIPLEGRRVRAWGEPVDLLAESGLAGWKPRDPKARFGWKVEGGVLSNSPPGDVDIVSERTFRDFKLRLEYKVPERSNSGVYLRGRYELQVVGDRNLRPHGNMAVYSRLSPEKNPMRSFDEWQTLEVTLIGRWVTVVLNGEVVHDNRYLEGITGGAFDPWEGEPGPLMLQGDHGQIWYRKIVVTPVR